MPEFAELIAPPQWRRIELISDLHLSPETPKTLAAFAAHLQETAADAVILLGDIFEVWVGDDARFDPFEAECCALFKRASQRLRLFFMAGNRDFLVGPDMLADCHMQGLADPTVLVAFGQRWLLTHGDVLCLEDKPYQAFRAQVRSPAWQGALLSKPLAERRAIGQQMRAVSRMKQTGDELWADLDAAASIEWLKAANCHAMIHGHTHRPAQHELAPGLTRHVLSDWDLDGQHGAKPRAEVLRLRQAGLRRIPLV